MQITFNTINNKTNLNYKGNCRYIKDDNGKLLYRTTTYLFRNDLRWNKFVNFLDLKYASADKVNIINHACSDGQETISLIIKLKHKLQEKAQKFFPIIAKDIDEKNIELAKQARYLFYAFELPRISRQKGANKEKFFDIEKKFSTNSDNFIFIPKPEITKEAIFSKADIFDDIDSFPNENTVVMCRNFWPYLSDEKRELLAKKLAKKLNQSCLLVFGKYDNEKNISRLLRKHGFKNVGIPYVYTKK